LIKPGEVIPGDGVIVEGESRSDESLLTGESMPVSRRCGDRVVGGATNIGSPLVVCLEKVGEATRLASIRRLMEQAAGEKPAIVQFADRIAMRFVWVLLVLASCTAIYWLNTTPDRALWVFVAVLVVSCPCALSLATPAALTVATGALAQDGVLVTRGYAIETLARATHWVFDKTGTLTVGRPVVVDIHYMDATRSEEVHALIRSLEQGSEHAVARALLEKVGAGETAVVSGIRAVTAKGIEARLQGNGTVRVGVPDFVAELHGQPSGFASDAWLKECSSVIALGDERGWLAWFRLSDGLRAEAREAITALHGQKLAILSGDAPETVAAIAQQVGIADFHGGMLPEDKHAFVRKLQADGQIVAMVGDGVNDAPVLAQAHISVAMGEGTDLARSQADVVLLSNNLAQLVRGIDRSKQALTIIRQNLLWAFGYNVIAIPMAMVGWITPWMAGIGMSASSLLVVLNALRLQRRTSVSVISEA
jgi:Cu2+-exporting ATPase